ncbi:MAG: DUF4270 family protein [Bacteroidetes bacterium]|nr:DUF4270 family protein [Bacteroidota bacterium]
MKRNNAFLLVLFFAFAGVFISCDKAKDISVKSATPDQSVVPLDDTSVIVEMQTVLWNSVLTNNLSKDMIGGFDDPVMGYTMASVYGQLRLAASPTKVDSFKKIKDVKLYLRYSGTRAYFGSLNYQVIDIEQIYNQLDNTNFYSNKLMSGSRIGAFAGLLSGTDSFLVVNLDTSFGGRLLRTDKKNYADNNSFTTLLKGIGIKANSPNTLMPFVLTDSSRLEINYNDSSKLILKFTKESNRVATYRHIFATSKASIQLKTSSTTYPEVYLQPLSGLKVNIKFKNLEKLAQKNAAVLQAALELPKVYPSPDNYPESPQLLIFPRGSNGDNETKNTAFDQTYTDDLFKEFDGKWNAQKQSYNFIITHHIQNLLERYKKQPGYVDANGMNLFIPADNPLTAKRVILATRYATTGKKPKLKLIYTNLRK